MHSPTQQEDDSRRPSLIFKATNHLSSGERTGTAQTESQLHLCAGDYEAGRASCQKTQHDSTYQHAEHPTVCVHGDNM